ESADLTFGDIDLHVTATAVKSPAFAGDQPARAQDPWGVAELFRAALIAAANFRDRRTQSRYRLFSTVVTAIGLIGLLVAFIAVFLAGRELTTAVTLAGKVESYRAREGPTASQRLREPLDRKAAELADLAGDPDFVNLAPDLQRFLRDRLAEISAYRDYKARLLRQRAPADARSEDDLQEIDQRLRQELPLPADYAAEWKQTDSAVIRDKWLEDIVALRGAAAFVAG